MAFSFKDTWVNVSRKDISSDCDLDFYMLLLQSTGIAFSLSNRCRLQVTVCRSSTQSYIYGIPWYTQGLLSQILTVARCQIKRTSKVCPMNTLGKSEIKNEVNESLHYWTKQLLFLIAIELTSRRDRCEDHNRFSLCNSLNSVHRREGQKCKKQRRNHVRSTFCYMMSKVQVPMSVILFVYVVIV